MAWTTFPGLLDNMIEGILTLSTLQRRAFISNSPDALRNIRNSCVLKNGFIFNSGCTSEHLEQADFVSNSECVPEHQEVKYRFK